MGLLRQSSRPSERLIKAGEVARIGANGVLLSKAPLSRERYGQLIQANMQGQNLLATTGMDWLIASRTPFPRLRGVDVLVVPANKLPQSSASTNYTYVCQGTGPGDYFPGGPLNGATRFTSTSTPTTANCAANAGGVYLTPVVI